MALTVETGAGVANANTYISLNDFRTFAEGHNFTLTDDDDLVEGWLRRAAFAMQTLAWKGVKVDTDNALAWPRSGVYVDDELLAEDAIPRGIIYGQAMLAVEMYAADALETTPGGGAAVAEHTVKVDVIEESKKFNLAYRNAGSVKAPAAAASSRAQFADYLRTRGLYSIQAVRS